MSGASATEVRGFLEQTQAAQAMFSGGMQPMDTLREMVGSFRADDGPARPVKMMHSSGMAEAEPSAGTAAPSARTDSKKAKDPMDGAALSGAAISATAVMNNLLTKKLDDFAGVGQEKPSIIGRGAKLVLSPVLAAVTFVAGIVEGAVRKVLSALLMFFDLALGDRFPAIKELRQKISIGSDISFLSAIGAVSTGAKSIGNIVRLQASEAALPSLYHAGKVCPVAVSTLLLSRVVELAHHALTGPGFLNGMADAVTSKNPEEKFAAFGRQFLGAFGGNKKALEALLGRHAGSMAQSLEDRLFAPAFKKALDAAVKLNGDKAIPKEAKDALEKTVREGIKQKIAAMPLLGEGQNVFAGIRADEAKAMAEAELKKAGAKPGALKMPASAEEAGNMQTAIRSQIEKARQFITENSGNDSKRTQVEAHQKRIELLERQLVQVRAVAATFEVEEPEGE